MADDISLNEKLENVALDEAVLNSNLSRIAYTLDKGYLSHLEDYGVWKFEEYCKSRGIEYEEGKSKNYMAVKVSRFIINKDEKVIDCMKNVIGAFSNSADSIAFVAHRTTDHVDLYFIFKKDGIIKTDYVLEKTNLLKNSFSGNFAGSTAELIEMHEELAKEFSFWDEVTHIAMLSAIPSDKSEDYISQGIEKLLNGVVPGSKDKEYTVFVLAESLTQESIRNIIGGFEDMATAITPYASHQFQTGKNDGETTGEMESSTDTKGVSHAITKTHSINVGVNAGRGSTTTLGENNAITDSESDTVTEGETETISYQESEMEGNQEADMTGNQQSSSKGSSNTLGASVGASVGASAGYQHGWNKSVSTGTSTAKTIGKSFAKTVSKGIAKSVAHSVAKTVGKAVTRGAFSSVAKMLSIGISGGYGYSWGKIDTDSESTSLTKGTNKSVTIGNTENTTFNYKSYQVSDLLQNLELTIQRLTKSKATGLWKTATYVLSNDDDTALQVANYLRGLTQGDESFTESAVVQSWGEDKTKADSPFPEIRKYITHFTHPIFVNGTDLNLNDVLRQKQELIAIATKAINNNPNITDKDAAINEVKAVIEQSNGVDLIPVTPTTNISTTELAKIFALPSHSLSGLPVLECAEFGRTVSSYDESKSERKIPLGKIFHMHAEEKLPVELDADSLASHTFITGSTGSGKSNTVYQLLDSLRKRGVNFLVVEPAKGEYKNVFGQDESDDLHCNVHVYGTNPSLSPLLRINPFSFPHGNTDESKNIHILEHLDRLIEIFNVCWPMYAAMPAVLKEAVEKSYEDCGWDLTASKNKYDQNLFPNFADVTRNIRTIIDSSDYDADNKGAYKGSLITRLKSLTNGINGQIFTDDEIPLADLFDKNVIVDLSRVGSAETKSLIMGLLVLKLQEHRMTSGMMNAPLCHVTVLEEAHNLLKRTSTEQSQESGNLLGKSVEMLTNSIAEMRTYGEGFIIADQAPALLDMAVIRNTNTKIIHRLPDKDDRELVGKAANLNDDQITELAKLPRGVAAVYQNEWVEAVLCKVRKFDVDGKAYSFTRAKAKAEEAHTADRLEIARLLCNGVAVTDEAKIRELKSRLDKLNLRGSTKVRILRSVSSPLESPRYTKLAPVVSELFPAVRSAFIASFERTSDTEQWTTDVDAAIRAQIQADMDEELRRSIRQCIITDYLHNELGKTDLLEKWATAGGVK